MQAEPMLRQGYFHTPEVAREELAAFAAGCPDEAAWRERAARVRQGILEGARLSPAPVRCLLQPTAVGRRVHGDCVVENVSLQSLPGFYVTGTLYRPASGTGPFAGVLLPHGHFSGPTGGRFQPDVQILAATLARAGAVVYAYDMVGWGESTQFPHKHPVALALQLWNSIRALDYLESRPDVDRRRLAVTGASGGGTQTFLLAAVDDRVAVSVPVVQVSAHFFGGCECESGLPIHAGPSHVTNNADIAALAAPRPQLIISDGKDWTSNTPEVEFPYIRRVYSLFDAGDAVQNAHFADEGHDYGPSKRASAIAFLGRHLRLDLDRVLGRDGRLDEGAVVIEPPKAMHCFAPQTPRPASALTDPSAIEALLAPR